MSISRHRIEAYFFGNPRSIAAKILFIKRDARLEEYKQQLNQMHEFGNVWRGVTGHTRGEEITVIATGIGPSLVSDAVYALDRSDSICLYSGTCGGLHKDLEIGDYVIADRAICGDGYSIQLGYPPLTEVSSDVRTLHALQSLIAMKVHRVSCGTAFTTSSVVRETDADFWDRVNGKCRIIEMAAAAFYAAAQATGKRAIAYFWVTDLPTRGKTFFDELAPDDTRTKQARYDRSADLDLELLVSL